MKNIFFTLKVAAVLIVCGCSRGNANKLSDCRTDAIFGMRIESTEISISGVITVISTGAIITIEPRKKTITIEQRIPKRRILGRLVIGDPAWWADFSPPSLSCKFDVICGNRKGRQLIISGDSVLRIYGTSRISWCSEFSPTHERKHIASHAIFLLDEAGGVVIAPPFNDTSVNSTQIGIGKWGIESAELIRVIYIGVCPPKHFDWERSMKKVVHYSSHLFRYPSDEQIQIYSKFASVLELHSWIWKNRYNPDGVDDEGNSPPRKWWDFSWIAPAGRWIPESESEIKRVIATAHQYGMKVIPYVNFDMAQTPQQLQGPDSRFEELRGLIKRYQFDGLYLDGIYCHDADQSYQIIRNLRLYLGKYGWLTHHNSDTGFPFLDCYADLIVTGEHSKFDRWTCTSYNISNSFAAFWPEIPLQVADGRDYLSSLIDQSLKANNRMLFLDGEQGQWRDWRLYYTTSEWNMVKTIYLPALDKIYLQKNTQQK